MFDMENDDEWNEDQLNGPIRDVAIMEMAVDGEVTIHQAFHHFFKLPPHIQHKIIRMLDKKTLLIISSVSWKFNQVASPFITKNFVLAMRFDSETCYSLRNQKAIADKIATILGNANEGRKYDKMILTEVGKAMTVDFRSLVILAISVIGRSVRNLCVEHSRMSFFDGVELLTCFKNIGKLQLSNVNIELSPSETIIAPSMLHTLKELIINCSSPRTLSWFLHCRNLEKIEFVMDLHLYIDFPFEYDMQKFEDFVIAQDNLRHLVMCYMLQLSMFEQDRSSDVKFQLESITLLETYFQNSVNALKFFKTQKNIKYFETWIEENDPRFLHSYMEILQFVYSSPTLLKVCTNIGLTNTLAFTVNRSVKYLELSERIDSSTIYSMMKIFPKIESIYSNSSFLSLIDEFKCEHLRLIKFYGQLSVFKYQPPNVDVERTTFEIMLKCFLLRNNKIRNLVIGNRNWIANGFGLSLKFCMDILRFLPNLTHLELYNPMHIKNLVTFLLCTRNHFDSITLYTDENRFVEVKRMRKNGLHIYVV